MQAKEDETKERSVIVAIAKTDDIEKVKAKIHDKYGFWPTDEYCRDLIVFVAEIAAEMMS